MDIWRWSADWIEWIFCYISATTRPKLIMYFLHSFLPCVAKYCPRGFTPPVPRTYPDVTTKKSMMFHMFRM